MLQLIFLVGVPEEHGQQEGIDDEIKKKGKIFNKCYYIQYIHALDLNIDKN